MTEQIKSAIKTFNQLLMLGRVDLPKEEIESNIKTAIRSLQSWEEVLQELEEKKDVYKLVPISSTAMGKAYTYDESTICMAIEVINKHLAEIEE